MLSSAWARTSLSISPLVDVIEASEPRRDLLLRNGIRTEDADGDGGSGAIPVGLSAVNYSLSAMDLSARVERMSCPDIFNCY